MQHLCKTIVWILTQSLMHLCEVFPVINILWNNSIQCEAREEIGFTFFPCFFLLPKKNLIWNLCEFVSALFQIKSITDGIQLKPKSRHNHGISLPLPRWNSGVQLSPDHKYIYPTCMKYQSPVKYFYSFVHASPTLRACRIQITTLGSAPPGNISCK